jgi:SAM-dependent methyltransferase
MSDHNKIYEKYHNECPFENFGLDTFQGDKAVAAYPDARTVLDFGCGNGYAVRKMRQSGGDWIGIEYSQAAYDKYLKESYFCTGTTKQFADRQFDMVYSTEVLEHVPEMDVPDVTRELCRLADKYLFLTISLRPSSDDNRYHCTLKPREWWEGKFTGHGFEIDRDVIKCFQRRTLKSTRRIFMKWAHFGPAAVSFARNPPFQLRGESQFWFFCFRRRGVPRLPLPEPTVSWYRRNVIPSLRRWWRAK